LGEVDLEALVVVDVHEVAKDFEEGPAVGVVDPCLVDEGRLVIEVDAVQLGEHRQSLQLSPALSQPAQLPIQLGLPLLQAAHLGLLKVKLPRLVVQLAAELPQLLLETCQVVAACAILLLQLVLFSFELGQEGLEVLGSALELAAEVVVGELRGKLGCDGGEVPAEAFILGLQVGHATGEEGEALLAGGLLLSEEAAGQDVGVALEALHLSILAEVHI
jgi:hypothetical protein